MIKLFSQVLALDLCTGGENVGRKKRGGGKSTKKATKQEQQQLSAGFTAGIWKGDVI